MAWRFFGVAAKERWTLSTQPQRDPCRRPDIRRMRWT